MSVPIKHYYHSTFSFLLQEIPLDFLDRISRKSSRLRLKIVYKGQRKGRFMEDHYSHV